jgi:uncharacterized damage-inducible protein DinB
MPSRERILTAPHLAELRRYLGDIRDLLSLFPLDYRWTPDGPSAGQIAFHAAEAADFWLRSVILGKGRLRDREAEFSRNPTRPEIREALDRATDACHLVEHAGPLGDQHVEVPEAFSPNSAATWTVELALIHITAHTAEHMGQLCVVRDLLSASAAGGPPSLGVSRQRYC